MRSHGRCRSEDGSASVFVVGLVTALLMVAGLVHDGGQILAARQEAFAVADNAARAAAQAVDIDALRATGTTRLDASEAQAAAAVYLDRVGHIGTVLVADDHVEVVVTVTVDTLLLRAIGLEARTVIGTGESRLVRGITEPEG